jgi:hypothetical protein
LIFELIHSASPPPERHAWTQRAQLQSRNYGIIV